MLWVGWGLLGFFFLFGVTFLVLVLVFFSNFFFTHHFVWSSQKQQQQKGWYYYLTPALQELWNLRSHPKGRLSPGWAHLGLTCCPGKWPHYQPRDESAAGCCRRPWVSAGFSSGTAAPQKPSSQPLKEWHKCNSWLVRASPIPQVPGIKTLKMFAPGAVINLLCSGAGTWGSQLSWGL